MSPPPSHRPHRHRHHRLRAPLLHDIANCIIVKTPPGSSPEPVFAALGKQFPAAPGGAMPVVIKGQRGLRFQRGRPAPACRYASYRG
ncbi:BZ3500_MvSof-1268-A1-R1_Chr11-1g03241 [Microbotryum saponariae]|uniref:BZ3500_MvSof-1268-A1-R1_Chr11-1g03241 protein n=1 Tax=Microbotryum saponariae TaxID=289078 RepID=A0A2X0LA88_9BASI|nr:BZ3501_MvSof-1269-A2-R1_Chr11g02816 [Microbotryum saponariae]SDA03801.1 BZ3500_MvSof-1268-A1-R1_Chr11-1g03241 [Microbotryum saponariae]